MSAVRLERSFLDANVLVYSDDRSAPEKSRRASLLIAEHMRAGTGVVSTQVLAEYFVNVTRKFKVALDPAAARRKVELLCTLAVVTPHKEDLLAAIDLNQKAGISLWDALVICAAHQADCRYLLTEDLQHGQVIDGVQIVNPFL